MKKDFYFEESHQCVKIKVVSCSCVARERDRQV